MHTSRTLARAARLAAAVTVGLVLLAACGNNDDKDAGTADAPAVTTPVTTPAPGGDASAAPSSDGAAKTITVSETEFTLDLPSATLAAGTYTFEVNNVGKIPHALSFDGPGVEDVATGQVAPGASGKVTVTFQPGTYDVYCPISDHKSRGMDKKITVT